MSDAMRAAASLYNNPRYFSESELRIQKNKIRRQRIVKRQLAALAIVIAFLIFFLVFMISSVLSDAQSDEYEVSYKYYKTVTVHAGDTVWSIASDYYSAEHYNSLNNYISEICSINSLGDADNINAGESIIIPYYSSEYK